MRSSYPGYVANTDVRACSSNQYVSDHSRGLAIDWSVRADNAAGEQLLAWLFEGDGGGNNHVRLRRLGISYIIWDNRIWRADQTADRSRTSSDVDTWRVYPTAECFAKYGSGTDCGHVRHMHISLSDRGGAQATSWWQPAMDGHRDTPTSSSPRPAQPPAPTYTGTVLMNNQGDGDVDLTIQFGQPYDVPLAGDWNGDGFDTVGIFRNGTWHLTDHNDTAPTAQQVFNFGSPGDIPVVGDWNNDGVDSNGVFRGGVWHISNENGGGAHQVTFGQPGDIPVVGDWNGDGTDTLGVFRAGMWYLNDGHDGTPEHVFAYGQPGDRPVVGDWNGDGVDTVGVVRSSTWHLNNTLGSDAGIVTPFIYGMPEDLSLTGDWDASGADSPAAAR